MSETSAALPYVMASDALADDSRLLLFHGHDLLLAPEGKFWLPAQLRQHGMNSWRCLPLRNDKHGLCAAVAVDDHNAALLAAQGRNTRSLLMEQGFDDFRLTGLGQQLSHWYSNHRFCGACGAPTAVRDSTGVLACAGCAMDFYPRISPCIIVLVTRGRELLLARHAHRGSDYFSCLAGFVEAGESAEEAVQREVAEEVGIRVQNLRYVSSQSWPFPSQLMLGFFADYAAGDLHPAPDELAEARWFDIDELPRTPGAAISVAGELIQRYRAPLYT